MKKLRLTLTCLMLAALCSCQSGTALPSDSSSGSATVPDSRSADPFDGVYFEDGKFNILYLASSHDLICAEEYTGDSMNDAIYERNLQVKDQLGVWNTGTAARWTR